MEEIESEYSLLQQSVALLQKKPEKQTSSKVN